MADAAEHSTRYLRQRNDGGAPSCEACVVDGLTPSLTIAALLSRWPAAAAVLIARRMACVGCEMNRFETIADAAAVYGVSQQELIGALRRAIENG
jgi:hybrid cluster-associated redox disulfide protein